MGATICVGDSVSLPSPAAGAGCCLPKNGKVVVETGDAGFAVLFVGGQGGTRGGAVNAGFGKKPTRGVASMVDCDEKIRSPVGSMAGSLVPWQPVSSARCKTAKANPN